MEDDGHRNVDLRVSRVHEAWVDHHERLWRAVLAFGGDREVAHDSVAEAFAQALRRGAEIDDVGRWVWRAAFRIAGGLLADRRVGDHAAADRAGDASLPDDVVALVDALGRITPSDRQIVVLCVVGGWSSGEVGRLMGLEPGNVRVRLHRAKRQLRQLLEDRDA